MEVYYEGEWGTVCDDHFGATDADVACRQLGYASASTYGSVRSLGYVNATVWLEIFEGYNFRGKAVFKHFAIYFWLLL